LPATGWASGRTPLPAPPPRRPLGGGRYITNVVLMGMGEPLYNFDNVKAAMEIVADGDGLSLSRRRITLSTSGVVPEIVRAGHEIGTMLAISLHATTDEVRNRLVPLNKKYPIAALLQACRDYPGLSNARRITFEYVMIKGLNDAPGDAKRLVQLLKGIPAKINLIPFNPWPGTAYECSDWETIERFAEIVNRAGYASPVRTPRGRDIMAACGQLKSDSLRLSARQRRASAEAAGQRGIAQQPALAERRVGHHRNPALLHPGQQVPFDAALAQMVLHLVGGASRARLKRQKLLHVGAIEVAHAPVADLAVALEPLEALDRLGERKPAAPMQQVEVDHVARQPGERALAGGDDAVSGSVVRVDLRHDEHLVAAARDRLCDHFFGAAFSVHFGRVDKSETEVEALTQNRDLLASFGGAFAHAPGAEPQGRDALTAGQCDMLHGRASSGSPRS
jgi:hypothetical protein